MKNLSLLRALTLAPLALLLALGSAHAETKDPTSAKSIAKPILMLMLYCHSALDTLADDVAKDPKPSLFEVDEKRQKAIAMVFDRNKLELGEKYIHTTQLNHLYQKSVEDGAIVFGEAKFLDLTARKDAKLWYVFAKEKCKKQIFAKRSEDEDDCLKKLNSEMHKCFIGFNERVDSFMKIQK